MDGNMDSGMGMNWGFLLFFVLIFWGFGGNGFGNRNYGNQMCEDVSNCDVKLQTVKNTAETNFLIEKRSWEVEGALANKIDYYEYMNLRDRLADEQRKNMALENRIYSDGQFNALNRRLDGIECHQLKVPEFQPVGGYVAATCGNWGGYNGCNGCGY